MIRLVAALLGMIGAASLRRVVGGIALVVIGALVLASAVGFGAVAVYQALLASFAPWQAALLIAAVLGLAGAIVAWVGSLRMRSHPTLREVRSALPSLESLAGLLGSGKARGATPLQMVALAALVGFALGRRR
jgi:hypothetical protein